MKATRFEMSSEFSTDAESLWNFHLQPEALKELSPWWLGMKIVDPGAGVADSSLVRAEVGVWPLRFNWDALHSSVKRHHSFTDIALDSPFQYWVHQHVIESVSPSLSRLTDVVWYVAPAWIPDFLARPACTIALRTLFKWRHSKTRKAVTSTTKPERSLQPQMAG